jgi:hypothetical protein
MSRPAYRPARPTAPGGICAAYGRPHPLNAGDNADSAGPAHALAAAGVSGASALMQSDDSVDAREAAAGYGIEPGGVESFV